MSKIKFTNEGIIMPDGVLLPWTIEDPFDIPEEYMDILRDSGLWGTFYIRRNAHLMRNEMQSGFSELNIKLDDISAAQLQIVDAQKSFLNKDEIHRLINDEINKTPRKRLNNLYQITKEITSIIMFFSLAGGLLGGLYLLFSNIIKGAGS